jgi:nucleoid DNA-binding protein
MALTKSQTIDKFSDQNGIGMDPSIRVGISLIEIIKTALASGDAVMISGW